jgi:ATP-dependent Clp endopeptidase proteolytic subunit ClpP
MTEQRPPTAEELAKIAAEAELARAEAAKAAAERRKLEAEAEKAEAEATDAKLKLELTRYSHSVTLASDERHRVYHFDSAVGPASVKSCMATLTTWHRIDPGCEITLVLNSPGGEIFSGMALFDHIAALRREGHHVITVARGMAASMAGILLQAGDERVMGPEAWLLIHEASFGAGGKIGEVEDTVELVRKIQDRILDIFASRSKLSKRQIERRWKRKDWWLSSDEALSLGFVDRVG